MKGYSNKQIEKLLEDIYSGEVDEYDLPEDLYLAIGKYLEKGLFKGFGGKLEDFEGKDLELLTELRENIWMFSAAKTFQQVKDIRDSMFDAKGDTRPWKDFRDDGREKYDKWNDDWGRSEWNTAIGQGQMAIRWQQIEGSKDVFPIIVFSTNGSPCAECAPFEGFAAPVDDPIWDWLVPLLHFNCMCILIQQEKVYALSENYDEVKSLRETVPDVFQMNPGKDKVVFKTEGKGQHPYFDVAPKDKEFAENNFGLPMPDDNE